MTWNKAPTQLFFLWGVIVLTIKCNAVERMSNCNLSCSKNLPRIFFFVPIAYCNFAINMREIFKSHTNNSNRTKEKQAKQVQQKSHWTFPILPFLVHDPVKLHLFSTLPCTRYQYDGIQFTIYNCSIQLIPTQPSMQTQPLSVPCPHVRPNIIPHIASNASLISQG